MKLKICGLFREDDIEYVNEAMPDYAGFVFAESRRQVSPLYAAGLRSRLRNEIIPVGVFVNAPAAEIAALYWDGVISLAQLHGTEDDVYVSRLKELSASNGKKSLPVIKTINMTQNYNELEYGYIDYYLVDSGAGSGVTFDWGILKQKNFAKPWFLAGGINNDNIEKAVTLNPFAIDVSSGVETNGVKDREKILQITSAIRKGKQI